MTSPRERWLWLAALMVTAVIFASLFLGQPLRGLLGSQNVQAAIFIGGMVMTALAITLYAFNHNPSRTNLIILAGIATTYGMLFLRLGLPERSHLIEYSLLALCVHEILLERSRNGREIRPVLIWAFAITFLIGCLDEFIQIFLPERVFDWYDIAFNAIVIFAALAARGIIDRVNRMRS